MREIEIPRYVAAGRAVFAGVPDSQLLNYGVPAEWLDDVRQVADEDALLAVADHVPAEAAEALLELATGSAPERPVRGSTVGDPFAHPDAERRFRVMSNQEELRRALEYPWESGRSFCIRLNGRWWNGPTAARRACQDLPEPARPSWRCIARCIWPAPIRTRACF